MIACLRDMLADTLLRWAGELIIEPGERAQFAIQIAPLLERRLRRYEREMAARAFQRNMGKK